MTQEWKSLIESTTQSQLDKLCDLLNQLEDKASSQKPDIGRLKAAMRGGTGVAPEAGFSINNSLDSSFQKPIRKSAPPSFQYTPPAELPEKFSEKKSGYDYRKAEKQPYGDGRKVAELDEAQILERLNQLLSENEVSGLNSDELAEVSKLQKKVR